MLYVTCDRHDREDIYASFLHKRVALLEEVPGDDIRLVVLTACFARSSRAAYTS